MRPATFYLVIATLLLFGCGSVPSAKPRLGTADVRPGQVRLGIDDRLSWPYRLERVLVVLDGEPVLRLDDGANPDRAAVEIPLVAGVHTIAVQLVAALPSGSRDEECLVRLRTAHSFGAGHEPMSILLVPFLGAQTAGFAERLELEIRFAGTLPIVEVEHVPPPGDAECADRPVIEQRICLAETRVAEARRQRDVIALACQVDKLEQMRDLATAGVHDREQRIEQLWQELEDCVGCPSYAFGSQTERMAYSDGCRDVDDLFEESHP
ncbi:MAG: hypothetical protein JRF63_03360 [Deltaproteobacteria bacterium]|nr:hypothetical protein [Deltaproteobacteria bacterium]